MYRRLVTFALLAVTVAVTTLVIPLALSARDLVRSGNLAALADQARVAADAWEGLVGSGSWSGGRSGGSDDAAGSDDSHSGNDASEAAPRVDLTEEFGGAILIYPDGTVVGGPVPPRAAEVVASARTGQSATLDTGSEGYAAAPAMFDERIGVVLAVAGPEQMHDGLEERLVALGGLCAALLVGAGVAGWQLATRTARPIRDLARTADELAAGDLASRADSSVIPEVDDVAVALNRLAGRVQELLAEEREAAAELAHQLRTPLTVLAADVDSVADPEVRTRLVEDVQTLQRTTDEIITSARRAAREGLHPTCDAAAVLAERAAFWKVLADYQGREMQVDDPGGPMPVRLTGYDLTTAVDILLQNVFTHTEEGVPLRLSIAGEAGGQVRIAVEDGGTGFPQGPRDGDRTGSTNLGLAIAERLAQASGGGLERGRSPLGGALVALILGPASD